MILKTIAAAAVLAVAAAPAHAGGFLKIPDIPGESQSRGHEGEIDIQSVSYAIDTPKPASIGAGRMRVRASVDSFTVTKSVDASSPYIALASLQQKSFDEVEILMTRPGAARQSYAVTLTKVRIKSVESVVSQDGATTETLGLVFEKIKILHEGASGDEHEIEYNVASGA